MKTFLKTTLKAWSALFGALSVLASATFIPEPYNAYVALAFAVATWATTYVVPYVQKAAEVVPDDFDWDSLTEADWAAVGDSWADDPEIEHVVQAFEPDAIIEPETVEMAVVPPVDTDGIPVIEHENLSPEPNSVEGIIQRLIDEGRLKPTYSL